jgi:hypothetical protein
MVALAICVILLSVLVQTLLASLRAEQTSAWLDEGSLLADRIAAAHYAGLSTTGIVAETWTVTDEEITEGKVQWKLWAISPADRPSLVVKSAFRK